MRFSAAISGTKSVEQKGESKCDVVETCALDETLSSQYLLFLWRIDSAAKEGVDEDIIINNGDDKAFDEQVLRALAEIVRGEGELDAQDASNALHGAVKGQTAGGTFVAEDGGYADWDDSEAARSRRHAVVSAAVGRFARQFGQKRRS